MSVLLLFIVMAISSGAILMLSMRWIVRPSPEANRMFTLVKSSREDKRKLSLSEQLTQRLAGRTLQARTRLSKSTNEKMLKRFGEAGLRGSYVPDLFFLAQGLSLITGAVAGSFLSRNTVFWLIAGAAGGYIAPDMWLTHQQKRRRDRVRRSIPDMVDLLVICVGAGLGLDQALLRVSQELNLSHPDLAEELERVTLERQAGAPRLEAWRAFADRTKIQEVAAFVSMLAETDRFGSPVTKALSDFSDELRTKRRQHAEEAAAKTKIKIIFPLVLCIFPCMFLVLLAPALLQFLHSFSTVGR